MCHFVAEMCTRVHISVTKWRIVRYLYKALWAVRDESTSIHCSVADHEHVAKLPVGLSHFRSVQTQAQEVDVIRTCGWVLVDDLHF